MEPATLFPTAAAWGATTVAGVAPIQAGIVPFFTFAGLLLLLRQASSPRLGALAGFGFTLGLFGVGVSGIFISLQRYSAMPDALSVVATVLFCACFALYPACRNFLPNPIRVRLDLENPGPKPCDITATGQQRARSHVGHVHGSHAKSKSS